MRKTTTAVIATVTAAAALTGCELPDPPKDDKAKSSAPAPKPTGPQCPTRGKKVTAHGATVTVTTPECDEDQDTFAPNRANVEVTNHRDPTATFEITTQVVDAKGKVYATEESNPGYADKGTTERQAVLFDIPQDGTRTKLVITKIVRYDFEKPDRSSGSSSGGADVPDVDVPEVDRPWICRRKWWC
ncbi:hypothetical protein Q5762_10850 [Streptomyces sp. P9(2023)]|uniref:hypothetical protein n=1 Tax=Streptomyces sp. P9(2023) TaxID=3064394 RepID=UPI0028F4490E|nr:hypothetical protein [Streptomyces sp. P9(2023)]MDT9688849.1 hypothetical protein [Streptomyces sp. P9(2023)]